MSGAKELERDTEKGTNVKYHITPMGKVEVCNAKKGKCPFGGEHYTDYALAVAAAQKSLEEEFTYNARQLIKRDYELGNVILGELKNILSDKDTNSYLGSPDKQYNFFFDKDGVLAEYCEDIVERMYDPLFFRERPPLPKAIEVAKKLSQKENVNLYILSKVPVNSTLAEQEKVDWLKEHMSFLDFDNVFIQNTSKKVSKLQFIRDKMDLKEDEYHILLDDHTPNLVSWDEESSNFSGIKILNEFNNKTGSWTRANKPIIQLD